jgi:hypothetical protein
MKPSRLALALSVAGLCATSTSYGAIVSGTFTVTSATLELLYSGTLDPPCTNNPPGSFFTCATPLPANSIDINNLGGGSGSITVNYDDTTGEITEVTDLEIILNDMIIDITTQAFGSAQVTVTQGNSIPTANDFPRIRAGTGAANGTADADQNAAVGIFQHDAPGSQTDSPDFATFTDIVDSCTPSGSGVCNLIPLLSIDALRYEIQGMVSNGALGGTLRAETQNNSNYIVEFSAIPLPAAGWLMLPAVGAVIARARRRTRR